jgi:VanZ family protein
MVAWMIFVFFMSTDVGASSNTGRLLIPILKWFDPHITLAGVERAHFIVRKAGHIIEYAILALLVLRALRILRPAPTPWSWPLATITLLLAAAYGATDELHQRFVASRESSLHDVVIDSSGARPEDHPARVRRRTPHSDRAEVRQLARRRRRAGVGFGC